MDPIRVTLCGDCEHCPEVEISDAGVRIGEAGNEVRLTLAQWKDLVEKIRAGDLGTA